MLASSRERLTSLPKSEGRDAALKALDAIEAIPKAAKSFIATTLDSAKASLRGIRKDDLAVLGHHVITLADVLQKGAFVFAAPVSPTLRAWSIDKDHTKVDERISIILYFRGVVEEALRPEQTARIPLPDWSEMEAALAKEIAKGDGALEELRAVKEALDLLKETRRTSAFALALAEMFDKTGDFKERFDHTLNLVLMTIAASKFKVRPPREYVADFNKALPESVSLTLLGNLNMNTVHAATNTAVEEIKRRWQLAQQLKQEKEIKAQLQDEEMDDNDNKDDDKKEDGDKKPQGAGDLRFLATFEDVQELKEVTKAHGERLESHEKKLEEHNEEIERQSDEIDELQFALKLYAEEQANRDQAILDQIEEEKEARLQLEEDVQEQHKQYDTKFEETDTKLKDHNDMIIKNAEDTAALKEQVSNLQNIFTSPAVQAAVRSVATPYSSFPQPQIPASTHNSNNKNLLGEFNRMGSPSLPTKTVAPKSAVAVPCKVSMSVPPPPSSTSTPSSNSSTTQSDKVAPSTLFATPSSPASASSSPLTPVADMVVSPADRYHFSSAVSNFDISHVVHVKGKQPHLAAVLAYVAVRVDVRTALPTGVKSGLPMALSLALDELSRGVGHKDARAFLSDMSSAVLTGKRSAQNPKSFLRQLLENDELVDELNGLLASTTPKAASLNESELVDAVSKGFGFASEFVEIDSTKPLHKKSAKQTVGPVVFRYKSKSYLAIPSTTKSP